MTSRREAICDAALELAAGGGNRAVTHHAVDDRLGLPRGSTSYYFRTRQDLLGAAIDRLTAESRKSFMSAMGSRAPSAPDVDGAADFIAAQLDLLLADRRRDALARYALATDVGDDLRAALATCLFSLPAAEELLASLGADDPLTAALDLVSMLEGLLFDRLYGIRSLRGIAPGTPASVADLRRAVRTVLVGVVCGVR